MLVNNANYKSKKTLDFTPTTPYLPEPHVLPTHSNSQQPTGHNTL